MFKKIFCLAIVANLGAPCFAQNADSVQMNAKQQEYLDTYRRAIEYDDMNSASYALTRLLMQGGNPKFKDTLAIIYYRTSNLNGAYKLATEINQVDPKDITALSLLADITHRAGDTKASLDWYEKLCPLSPLPFNYYQLATRQFILERVGECKISLNKVVADSVQARKEKVGLEISAGNSENVTVLAAAYNMLGALAYKEKNTAEAKRYYGLAVKEFPEFVIARQNLDGLKTPPPATKTAPKKS